ncbi:MAG: universal stress protein [Rhodospirillales bacterium]|nr:universal stress protein [Rhodospirillales bacterium]
MTLKSILVSVEQSQLLDSVFETALLVARRFDSYMEGLYLRSAMSPVVAADGISMAAQTAWEEFENEERERARRARGLFESFLRDKGVDWAPETGAATVSAGWLDDLSPGEQLIGSRGRVFDLIVTGRPVRGAEVPRMSILESALFDSGRPVLIAPPTPPATLGEVIVIAWNGSMESARAVALAMPLLARARQVHVLAVEGGSVPGPDAAELERSLLRNDVSAEATGVRPGERSVGEAILEEAAGLGADLLIKGAYTHSRLRQLIFGGATSHILAEADLPVLMAH